MKFVIITASGNSTICNLINFIRISILFCSCLGDCYCTCSQTPLFSPSIEPQGWSDLTIELPTLTECVMEMAVKFTCPNIIDNVLVTLLESKRIYDKEDDTFELFHHQVWDSISEACYEGTLVELMLYEAGENRC